MGTHDDRPGDATVTETGRFSPYEIDRMQAAGAAWDAGIRLTLQIVHRDGVHEVPLVEGNGVVVGRSPLADATIRDASLSRRHARVELIDGKVWLEDLGSTNGTWVEGDRVERQVVAVGDALAFGGATASIVEVTPDRGRRQQLDSHDAFVAALDTEINRSRTFQRPVALLMVRGRPGRRPPVGIWVSTIAERLRPFDRMALYSPDVVEVMLPESDLAEARRLAAEITEQAGPALCGIAVCPHHAGSAEALLEMAWRAAQRARSDQPVRVVEETHSLVLLPGDAGEDAGPVVRSPSMRVIFETAARLATSTIPVLIVGETGVGKEVVAREIHRLGPRSDGPLVCVNCGGIPTQLVESILFGHEKGSFTGASQRAIGLFESADGGTILLDEVGELPATAQAALLRVLDTRRVTRVGASRETEVDVRVLAVTHRDLEDMVRDGTFRDDLLYRLNAMTLPIPPLRERPEDVEALVELFVHQANRANRRQVRGIEPRARELLRAHRWPGNVRELRNAIERGVVIAHGEVLTVDDLPEQVRRLEQLSPQAPALFQDTTLHETLIEGATGLRDRLQRFESQLIVDALRRSGGDRKRAAELLELPLRTLNHKIKALGIRRGEYETPDD